MSSLIPSLWNEQGNPFVSLHKEMDKLFDDFGRKLPAGQAFGGGFPSIDVAETELGLELTAELPGVDEKNIDVSVSDRILTLKGEKTEEKTIDEKDRHVSERSFGSFRRVMTLPFAPKQDGIEAHMENGVLTVVLPRPEEEDPKSRKIEVKRKS